MMKLLPTAFVFRVSSYCINNWPTFGYVLWHTRGVNVEVLSASLGAQLHSSLLRLVFKIQLRPLVCVLKHKMISCHRRTVH